MDVTRDLVRSQFHQMREGQFRKQLGHFGTDHVRAQNFAVLFIHHDLYPTSIVTQSQRLAIRLEGKRPILIV